MSQHEWSDDGGAPRFAPDRYRSNQETLGNGCVCETGCENCDRLAEAWEAMREALREATTERPKASLSSALATIDKARAALALADRVKVRQ